MCVGLEEATYDVEENAKSAEVYFLSDAVCSVEIEVGISGGLEVTVTADNVDDSG